MPGHGERIIQTFDEWVVRINKRVQRLERRLAQNGSGSGPAGVGISSIVESPTGSLLVNLTDGSTQGPFPMPVGPSGADGSTWTTGTTVPGAGTGDDGDFFLHSGTGQVWRKVAGVWVDTGTNLTGPVGPSPTVTSGTVAWASGFENYNTGTESPLRWELVGDTVYLRGTAKASDSTAAAGIAATNGITMANLPSQLWPYSIVTTVQQSSSANYYCVRIDESGRLYGGRHSGAPSTSTWLPMILTYRRSQ